MRETLFESWKREINSQSAPAGSLVRNVMSSARLTRLADGYRSPRRRSMHDVLERLRLSIVGPVETAAEAERRPAARREELARLIEGAGRELDALTCYDTPEQAGELLRRREALGFLLAKVPPPVEVPDAFSLNARVREAVEAEVERLRRWKDSLVKECKLIKAEVEEHERRGAPEVPGRQLRQDLADVLQAMSEAQENLKLAERPPLRQPMGSQPGNPAPAPPRPPSGPHDVPLTRPAHWSLR